ncbi:aspartate aminotransferase family protein [bacterium]|nr:aspartate aminotransferase family protein [bacterium]
MSLEEILEKREKHISKSLSIGHGKPLHIIRGDMQYLYSKSGEKYLDLVNNVCHVGHCNPHVVSSGQKQMALLNTNTRYIYDGLTKYIERISNTLPGQLDVGFLVNSGSEANELAIRLARAYTKNHDIVVVEGAYHGHTGMLIDLSPYKFRGPGGKGSSENWVHVVPVPDTYRDSSRDYIGELHDIVSEAEPIAGFIVESMLSCAGQIPLPEGYLAKSFECIRKVGGLCIADEVQVGFGRTGKQMWAFEEHGVIPDIVVMGKPIGNGHPMAAVFTTKEIASAFEEMEFFSTFGGNPVSCAIGMAVLDVIENEKLIEHSRLMGELFIDGLTKLKKQHKLIGDIRGKGLFLGIELVKDHLTLEPATKETKLLVEGMLSKKILLSIDGPRKNVIKIKPPLVISEEDVKKTLSSLDEILTDIGERNYD